MDLLTKNYIKYGLIMSGITALCLLLMQVTGQNQMFDNKSPIQLVAQFVAPLIVWFFGIRARKKELKNKMTYKQGFIEGFRISLVYAIVSPFIFMFYYIFINPAILESVRKIYHLTNTSNEMIIASDMLAQFVAALIFGTIISAVLATYLKTKS